MNLKKIISVFCAAAAVNFAAPLNIVPKDISCISASAAETQTLTFNAIGQTSQITLSGTDETPTWYSDNTNVATVDQNGKVTSVGEGTCKAYAVFSNQVLECIVKVEIPEEQKEFVIGEITLTNDKPAVELSLSEIDMKDAVWQSSDTNVATVDQNGKITAVNSGKCTVFFELDGKKYIVNVTSSYSPQTTQPPVTEVILGTLNLNNTNPSAAITLSGVPDGTTVVWSSDNENVAKVDQSGKVTAVSSGSCKIIALIDGVKYITNVSSSYDPSSIPTKPTDVFLNNMELSNDSPSGTITLSGVDEGTVITWVSSDENVAVVDQNGKVTAVGSGTCRIIAVIDGVNYYMNVTSTYVPVEDIAITADSDVIEKVGDTLKLELINTDKSAEWISTNVNVLTVDSNGLVTATGVGTANIIAKVDNKVMTITITVKNQAGSETNYGDADLDGNVSINDAVKIMSHVSNSSSYPLTAQALDNADVYSRGDGISNMDALAIQKYLAEIIKSLPES